MEGQSGEQNPSCFISWSYNGNACYVPGNEKNQNFTISTGPDEHIAECGLSLSQWLHPSRIPRSYVELLNDDPTYLENAPTPHVTESISLPVGGTDALDAVYKMQKETAHNSLVLQETFDFRPKDSSVRVGASKIKPSVRVQKSDNHQTSVVKPRVEQGYSNKWMHPHPHSQTHSKELAIGKQEQSEDNLDFSQFHPEVRVAPSVLTPKHNILSKEKAWARERERKLRIADKIKALQELLVNPVEDTQEAILNDVIDHVKFLQLQIKELSRSRLGGEPTSYPLISIEGYGHYVHHEQMMKEPLEEMLATLLKSDPSTARRLLESKGLYLMPMALVEGFCQTT